MFNFIFPNNKINNSTLWLNALSEKEGKKRVMHEAIASPALFVQNEYNVRAMQNLNSQSHSLYAVSGNEGDEQQIGDIYSELDTVPLPFSPFRLAF